MPCVRRLTHYNVAGVHLHKGVIKFPDRPKGLALERSENCQTDHSAGDCIGGHLVELHPSPVKDFKGKQGPCKAHTLSQAKEGIPST